MFPATNKNNAGKKNSGKKNAGMSTIELLIAFGITTLVAVGINRMWTTYSDSRWGTETLANIQADLTIIKSMIQDDVPKVISANSSSDPTASAIWSCPDNGPCSFISDNRQNGIELTVSCVSTTSGGLLSLTPFSTLSTLPTGGDCSHCPAGKRPVMTVKKYSSGALKRTLQFPRSSGQENLVGMIGLGMCFMAPPRVVGTATIYDQWTISLVPIYYKLPPKGTSAYISGILASRRENILLGPLGQLGSKITIEN